MFRNQVPVSFSMKNKNDKNGYTQNGEPTVKQMEAYIHGVKIYSIFNNRNCIIFPILCAKEITSISIDNM